MTVKAALQVNGHWGNVKLVGALEPEGIKSEGPLHLKSFHFGSVHPIFFLVLIMIIVVPTNFIKLNYKEGQCRSL